MATLRSATSTPQPSDLELSLKDILGIGTNSAASADKAVEGLRCVIVA